MKRFILLFCLYLVCDSKEDEREGKFFFGPKMQTVVAYKRVPEYVTEFVPSSCVVIEPSLAPCRHVRNLDIYPSTPTRITKTLTPQMQNAQSVENLNWKPVVHPSETNHKPTPPLQARPQQIKNPMSHWNWNLFSIFRVENITYTTTKTEYVTTRIEDPHTVVSFYVRGCRPSRLPFDIPECPIPHDYKQQENIVVMAPLKFVPSDTFIVPSTPENVTQVREDVEVAENITTIENN